MSKEDSGIEGYTLHEDPKKRLLQLAAIQAAGKSALMERLTSPLARIKFVNGLFELLIISENEYPSEWTSRNSQALFENITSKAYVNPARTLSICLADKSWGVKPRECQRYIKNSFFNAIRFLDQLDDQLIS